MVYSAACEQVTCIAFVIKRRPRFFRENKICSMPNFETQSYLDAHGVFDLIMWPLQSILRTVFLFCVGLNFVQCQTVIFCLPVL